MLLFTLTSCDSKQLLLNFLRLHIIRVRDGNLMLVALMKYLFMLDFFFILIRLIIVYIYLLYWNIIEYIDLKYASHCYIRG